MIEKHLVLEDIDPVVFYGVSNGHLQMIRSLYPKLRIVARDNVIRVLGDEEQMASFEENVEKIRRHVLRFNALKEEDILDIIKGKRTKDEVGIHAVRMGNIAGVHEVMIGTQNERITLKHEAFSRGVFAEGSLKAAAFLIGKPAGMYDMKDLLRGDF